MGVQQKIRGHIFETILFGDGDKVDDNASFQESGILDSNGFLELITFVEDEFDIELSNEELVPEYLDSIEKISSLVKKKLAGKETDKV
jgi:acyl carrier protein